MSHRLNISAMLALSLSLSSGAVPAAERDATEYSIDAFGTLGVVHSDYREADFVTSSPLYGRGAGYSRSWRADQDTRLGLQLSADVGKLSAVVQGISRLRYDNSFSPELEWANVSFAITPELSVRAGRVVLPTFLSSDTENIGYARPWVRTPGEIRVQLPMTSSDGVDVSYRLNVGQTSHRVQLLYGRNEEQLPLGQVFENHHIRTVTDTIERGHLTMHLGYQRMNYRISPSPSEYAFEAIDVGVAYDPGDWYVIAEQFNTRDQGLGNIRASSLGGGYRIGSVAPYLIGSRIKQSSLGSLRLAPVFNQRTLAAGLRWDFARNMDLKVQYETVRIGSVSTPASFIDVQPGARIGDDAQIFSATLDFVW
ncbi:MAG: hypothetical protein SXG53_13680 [Pseudomonadota bacterium]|nr:hypothetical protein [Pseudomonadota bacterium]